MNECDLLKELLKEQKKTNKLLRKQNLLLMMNAIVSGNDIDPTIQRRACTHIESLYNSELEDIADFVRLMEGER